MAHRPVCRASVRRSLVQEDSKVRPLSTESGWDGIINYQAQFCGMSWGIVPTTNRPKWSRLMKFQYPPATWDIYPVAQIIAHDKLAMVHHDLGQFVTGRPTLTWTLALGYGMSYRVNAARMGDDAVRQWMLWLDRVQKCICARYTGEPLVAWHHDRKVADEDELIDVTYGPVRIIANVGARPREVEGRMISGFGFRASASGLIAADLGTEAAYVAEGDADRAELWVYSAGGQAVDVELPGGMAGPVTVTLEGEPAEKRMISGRGVPLRLPAPTVAGGAPRLWHAVIVRDGR